MKTLLITGATGFIGRHLVEELKADYHLLCLVRDREKARHLAADAVELVAGDVTDKETLRQAVQRADAVIHAAALYRLQNFDRKEMYQVNVRGTRNVFELCSEYQRPVIHFSSVAVLSPTGLLKERFATLYEETKFLSHLIAREYAPELPVTVVLPSVVFGPGDTGRLGDLLRQFLAGRVPAVPFSDARLSFVYVKDVASAVRLLLNSGLTGEYIASAHVMKLGAMVRLWSGITGLPLPALWGRRRTRLAGFLLKASRNPPLTSETIDFVYGTSFFLGNKLLKAGWHPTPLQDALEETIQWEKQQTRADTPP